MKRRDFLQHSAAATAFAFLPAFTRDAFAAAATLDDLVISEVEILKLSGTHELVKGLNRQYQVNPLHLYEERRPKPFVDPANGKAGAAAAHALLRPHSHQGRRRRPLRRRRQGSAAGTAGHTAAADHRPERARGGTHLGPDVPLEPSFARQPFHDGHQLHRQRAVGPARPAFRRAGVPVVRRADAVAGARLRQLPGVRHRSAARGEARRAACRRMASSTRSGSWGTALATARGAWI